MTWVPGSLVMFDIWRDGRVLLARADRRREVMSLSDGAAKERDLSWLDYSYPADLSADGKTLLFDEEGIGGGVQYGDVQDLTYAVYIRATDGTPAIRLGEGGATALSPDQKWVIIATPTSPEQLRLLPTGAGETQSLTNDSINHQWVDGSPTASTLFSPATNRERAFGSIHRILPGKTEGNFPRRRRRPGIRGFARRPVGGGNWPRPEGVHIFIGRSGPSPGEWNGARRYPHQLEPGLALTLSLPQR